jgi:hypothetical protein
MRSEHHNIVPGTGELLCGGESGGTGTNDNNALAGLHRRHLRDDPAFAPCTVDDLDLDLLDGDSIGVDAKHTRRLAWSRAESTGELGKVIRGMQTIDGVTPMVAIHQIVPVGNQVSERAAVVAKRNTAVHATASLSGDLGNIERLVDLFPVAQAHRHRAARRSVALPFQKPCGFTHHTLSITRALVCSSLRPAACASRMTVSTRL